MKIIFMGTPYFSCFALKSLINAGYELAAIYTQKSKNISNRNKSKNSDIYNLALENNIIVKTPDSLKDKSVQDDLFSINADLIIVSAYGMIIPKSIIESKKYGCINIHPSELPRWRGAAPIQRTILAGDKTTSVCIMQMDSGLDTGPILLKKDIDIENKSFTDLHDELASIGSDLLINVIRNIDNIKATDQSSIGITYAEKIDKKEYLINWNNNIHQIDRIIRAFDYSGAYFEFNNDRIKIYKASYRLKDHNYAIGEVIDNSLTIAVDGGFIYPITVQRMGKNMMNIKDMLRGYNIPPGNIL